MKNPRFSLDEFKTLFAGKFESQEELLKEYDSFLLILEQLDQAPIPELSAREKAEIFRRSWQGQSYERSWLWAWLALLRRPAVTFALGLALGCVVMLACVQTRTDTSQSTAKESPFTVERTRYAQTYAGKALQGLYPQIENPKLVVEKTRESADPQRVLYGTLDDGEIYVAWNL
jgi:hypothetical protein